MKRFTVRWLNPMTDKVVAETSEEAHAQWVLPPGGILQGIYATDGPVPPQFGGPPDQPPPSTTPLHPKPIGGGTPGAGRLPVEPENTKAVAA